MAAAGERNRALTIVKSRGTGHSNQVRELILSSQGLSLVDVYTAGGAVLMGTLRRQKEEQERAEQTRVARAPSRSADDEIASAIAESPEPRIASLRADVERKKAELRLLKESSKAGAAVGAANLAVLRTAARRRPGPEKADRRWPSAAREDSQVGSLVSAGLSLRLFVAGDSPDSAIAIANLKALFPNDGGCPVEIEIVDVQQDPARAARDGIMVTPTLLKVSPAPDLPHPREPEEPRRPLAPARYRSQRRKPWRRITTRPGPPVSSAAWKARRRRPASPRARDDDKVSGPIRTEGFIEGKRKRARTQAAEAAKKAKDKK